jgi:hypothetical protein
MTSLYKGGQQIRPDMPASANHYYPRHLFHPGLSYIPSSVL